MAVQEAPSARGLGEVGGIVLHRPFQPGGERVIVVEARESFEQVMNSTSPRDAGTSGGATTGGAAKRCHDEPLAVGTVIESGTTRCGGSNSYSTSTGSAASGPI